MGAPVPSASHKARTIISYFILYISTLRRERERAGERKRETLTQGTPREGGAKSKRGKKRAQIVVEIALRRAGPSSALFADNKQSRRYPFSTLENASAARMESGEKKEGKKGFSRKRRGAFVARQCSPV